MINYSAIGYALNNRSGSIPGISVGESDQQASQQLIQTKGFLTSCLQLEVGPASITKRSEQEIYYAKGITLEGRLIIRNSKPYSKTFLVILLIASFLLPQHAVVIIGRVSGMIYGHGRRDSDGQYRTKKNQYNPIVHSETNAEF